MTIDTARGFAVLWTKQSFEGDLRIEYDFKRVDAKHRGVNIIYIQATGDGQKGCVEDISPWSDRRKLAAMSDYFMNMHTYHVSYATDKSDYIRGRRYLPLANKGLGGTALSGEHTKVGLFGDKKWIHITLIKQSKQLWMEFKHPDKTLLCQFQNKDKPGIDKGRIGLRLMPGRMSQFKNFRVMSKESSIPAKKKDNGQVRVEKAETDGWRCNVIQPDPKDHGPDGINIHDWDGDIDMVVPDRGVEICWYVNPGKDKVTGKWERKTLHKHHEPMFMTVADVNGDKINDFVITGGSKGTMGKKLIILLRTNKSGDSTFKEILIDQPCGNFPKGVAVMDLDGDRTKHEIVVIPKQGDIWSATYTGDSMQADNWKAELIWIPQAETRKKMDNAFLGDINGDGDLDVATTEENGGWGVIWFENPQIN